jgi:hypothetical protein
MRLGLRAAVSKRSVRVLLLTALLTTVACECDDSTALSACISEIFHAPCYVANVDLPSQSCIYKIKVIPPESNCASCSTCSDLADGYVNVTYESAGCATNCRISCPPGEVICPPTSAPELERTRGLSDAEPRR